MNGNGELLNFIYQNSQMGTETISHLLEITEDKNFKLQLQEQIGEYESIRATARDMLISNGYDEKGITAFEKIRTYLMINIQTLKDKTASHISEMLIIGSNMGVIDAIKNIRKYKNAEKDISRLMEKLLEMEEHNIEQLKKFL